MVEVVLEKAISFLGGIWKFAERFGKSSKQIFKRLEHNELEAVSSGDGHGLVQGLDLRVAAFVFFANLCETGSNDEDYARFMDETHGAGAVAAAMTSLVGSNPVDRPLHFHAAAFLSAYLKLADRMKKYDVVVACLEEEFMGDAGMNAIDLSVIYESFPQSVR